jgi:hypothetical protein
LTNVGCWEARDAARRAPFKPVGRFWVTPGLLIERRVRAGVATRTARFLGRNRHEMPANGGGWVTVPQTDTGRLAEEAKVDE